MTGFAGAGKRRPRAGGPSPAPRISRRPLYTICSCSQYVLLRVGDGNIAPFIEFYFRTIFRRVFGEKPRSPLPQPAFHRTFSFLTPSQFGTDSYRVRLTISLVALA